MCYTVESSLVALITGAIGALTLAWKGDPYEVILALLFLFVIVMQFFDAVFWSTEKQVKEGDRSAIFINRFFTKMAILFNHLQPIVLGGLIVYVTQNGLPLLSTLALITYALVAVTYTSNVWNDIDVTIEQPPAKPGLYWAWTKGEHYENMYRIFMVCLGILMLENLSTKAALLGLSLTAGTLFFSLERHGGKSDAGRWWCNYAAYIPLLYQVLNAGL